MEYHSSYTLTSYFPKQLKLSPFEWLKLRMWTLLTKVSKQVTPCIST